MNTIKKLLGYKENDCKYCGKHMVHKRKVNEDICKPCFQYRAMTFSSILESNLKKYAFPERMLKHDEIVEQTMKEVWG